MVLPRLPGLWGAWDVRARNLKPGYFKNEGLADLPPLARILFAGLWGMADREGRLEDRPKRIKAEILPYDNCDTDKLEAERDAANRLLETEREVMRLELEAERDEAWTAYKQALNDNGVLKDLEYETRQERDALAAEVKRLEAVAEAADELAQEQQVSGRLCAALAAWREGEGGCSR